MPVRIPAIYDVDQEILFEKALDLGLVEKKDEAVIEHDDLADLLIEYYND